MFGPGVHLKPASTGADWWVWKHPPQWWIDQVSQVPGLRWNSDGQAITSVQLHRTHFPLLPQGTTYEPPSTPLPNLDMLRDYQRVAVHWALQRRGVILGFDMRLGKTPTATHLHNPETGPLVVVGPLAARQVWAEWIERVWGTSPVLLAGAQNVEIIDDRAAYFCHYDILRAQSQCLGRLPRIGTLVLDECHLLKNRKSVRYNACVPLAARATRIIGLTGTAIWSTPDTLFPLLDLIAPRAFGTHFEWGRRYCNALPTAHGWSFSGASNQDELRTRLEQIICRQTWRNVAPQLPPITRNVDIVTVPPKVQAKVEQQVHVALHQAGEGGTVAGALAKLRASLAQLKVKPTVRVAQDAMAAGHKVVVWTWHKAIAKELIVECGKVCPTYYVQQWDSASARERQMQLFRDETRPTVIVASLAIAAMAIDLSVSDFAIFTEVDWTPGTVAQAEMRTFAPARPHAATYLCLDIPLEHHIFEVLGVKEGFANTLGLGETQIGQQVLARLQSRVAQ